MGRRILIAIALGILVGSSVVTGADPQDTIVLQMQKGPGAGQVTLAWTGGIAPFQVFRAGAAPGLVSAPNSLGITVNRTWIDLPPAGTLLFYEVTPTLCGAGPPCGEGQRCLAGACICDPISCPSGCCQGATCTSPTASACGAGGVQCVSCGDSGDSCVNGICRCGGAPACGPGQHWVGGACVCDASSCPFGSCN